jgi:hypothetical protein
VKQHYVIAVGHSPSELTDAVNKLVEQGYYPCPVPITAVTYTELQDRPFVELYQPMWNAHPSGGAV